MKKNQHKTLLSLALSMVLLCAVLIFFFSCNKSDNFEREIACISDWHYSAPSKTDNKTVNFISNFSIHPEPDQLYFLQLSPANGLIQSRFNHSLISGTYGKNNEIQFNITEYIKQKNSIELTYNTKQQLNAKIQHVNKLFISHITVSKNGENAQVRVKVKNAFNTEQQAMLKYTLYQGSKKSSTKETPVFISGNSENLYSQEFKINSPEQYAGQLKVVCRLYSNGKIFDQISDEL